MKLTFPAIGSRYVILQDYKKLHKIKNIEDDYADCKKGDILILKSIRKRYVKFQLRGPSEETISEAIFKKSIKIFEDKINEFKCSMELMKALNNAEVVYVKDEFRRVSKLVPTNEEETIAFQKYWTPKKTRNSAMHKFSLEQSIQAYSNTIQNQKMIQNSIIFVYFSYKDLANLDLEIL